MPTDNPKQIVARFAPSPSGRMHAGNIASALVTWLLTRLQGGRIVLRIEDLDRSRSKKEYADGILSDFEKLGLNWDEGPYFQANDQDSYADAFQQLTECKHVYPCFCSRADLAAARAPHEGEYAVYPGTCRHLSSEVISDSLTRKQPSYRIEMPHQTIAFDDVFQGPQAFNLGAQCGDVILRRADGSFSYQLAVSVDDARQGITLVSRGYDLLPSTPVQIFLLKSLGYAAPGYAHLPLLITEDGVRLSKRNKDASIEDMLATYHTHEGIIGHIAWLYGLIGEDEPISPGELSDYLDYAFLESTLRNRTTVVWRA